jgi:hypothetical protein
MWGRGGDPKVGLDEVAKKEILALSEGQTPVVQPEHSHYLTEPFPTANTLKQRITRLVLQCSILNHPAE